LNIFLLKSGAKRGLRNTENENLLAEQNNRISELIEQNKLLKQRVLVSHQQVQAAQSMKRSNTTYDSISSRIDTVKKFFYIYFILF
jgi:cell fate (sporulation/competence/biofilm development) regulator YmcA (YheA/YmcA/DUF963 family)